MAKGKVTIDAKSKYHPDAGKGFASFLYDSDEGTVMGRTAGSWVKIIIFYIIFYACLAAFASFYFYLFSRSLNDQSPKWMLSESLIGDNPGIGFRPMPDQDVNPQSTLIWYQSDDEKDSLVWYKQLREFIQKSEQPVGAAGVKDCNYDGSSADMKAACRVDLTNLGGCTLESKFGYRDARPCILIKLNKIYGWEPEPYGVEGGKYSAEALKTDLEDRMAAGMPTDLADHILSEVKKYPGNEVNLLKTVWMSCEGENVGDKENLPATSINYYPKRGIPGYYFPYQNQKTFRSPFVFAQINLPNSSKNTLVNIECRAWAKNVIYDRQNRLGSVHFEVMID